MGVPYQNTDMTSHLQYLTVRNERGRELLDAGASSFRVFSAASHCVNHVGRASCPAALRRVRKALAPLRHAPLQRPLRACRPARLLCQPPASAAS